MGLMGKFTVRNLRTGEWGEAYGVFTRNFPRVLGVLFRGLSDVPEGSTVTATVVDDAGASQNVVVAGSIKLSALTDYGGGLEIKVGGSPGPVSVGAFFRLGDNSTAPTPNDYNLKNTVMSGIALSAAVKEDTGSTTLELTATALATQAFTCREVGLFLKILKGGLKVPDYVVIMVDRAVVSDISFNANDPIAIRYALTFA